MKYLITLLALISCSVYANEYTDIIHKTKVNVGAHECCGQFYISTLYGHLVNGTCQYQGETPKEQTSICEVSGNTFTLDGQELKSIIGGGYNCGATHITDTPFPVDSSDPFNLVSDASGNYVATNPGAGEVSINICN